VSNVDWQGKNDPEKSVSEQAKCRGGVGSDCVLGSKRNHQNLFKNEVNRMEKIQVGDDKSEGNSVAGKGGECCMARSTTKRK